MRGGSAFLAICIALGGAVTGCEGPPPLHSIRGRALTVSGNALPGIAVHAHGPDGDDATVTGLDGAFLLASLRPGTYEVTLEDPWVSPSRRVEEVQLGDFVDLGPLQFTTVGRLSGQVTATPARSLGLATVSTADGTDTALVDADGHFSFLVPSGTHQVVARLGVAAAGAPAEVAWRSETSVALVLSPNTSPLNVPRFHYVDRTTHEGIAVHLHAKTDDGGSYDEDAITFADGSIEVPGCPRGTVTLTASAPGYGTASASALVCPQWEEAVPATREVVLYHGERFGPLSSQWAAASEQGAVVAAGATLYAFPNPAPATVRAAPGKVLAGGTATRFLITQGAGSAVGVVDLALRRGSTIQGSMRDFAVRPDLSFMFTANPYPTLIDLDGLLAGAANAVLPLSSGESFGSTRRGCFQVGGAFRDRVEPFDLSAAGTAAWTSVNKSYSLHIRERDGHLVSSPVYRPDFVAFADETVVFQAASALDVNVARPFLYAASKASAWAPAPLTEVQTCSTVYLASDHRHLLVDVGQSSWTLLGLDGTKVRELGQAQLVTVGDGRRALLSGVAGPYVLDLLTGTTVPLAHPAGQFTNNLFSPSEEALAYLSTVGNLAHLRLAELTSGRDVDLGEVLPDAQLRFSSNGSTLVFETATGVQSVPVDGHTGPVLLGPGKLMGVSSSGRFAATSDGTSFTAAAIDGATKYTFAWVPASNASAAFTPDDAAVAVRLKSKELMLVDLRTGSALTLDGTVSHFAVLATTPPTVVYDVSEMSRAGLYQFVVH